MRRFGDIGRPPKKAKQEPRSKAKQIGDMPIVISDLDYPPLGPRVPKPKPKPKPMYKSRKIFLASLANRGYGVEICCRVSQYILRAV